MASVTARMAIKLPGDNDFLTIEISRGEEDMDKDIRPLVQRTMNDLNDVFRDANILTSVCDSAYGAKQYYEELAYKKGVLKQ